MKFKTFSRSGSYAYPEVNIRASDHLDYKSTDLESIVQSN